MNMLIPLTCIVIAVLAVLAVLALVWQIEQRRSAWLTADRYRRERDEEKEKRLELYSGMRDLAYLVRDLPEDDERRRIVARHIWMPGLAAENPKK
ncbi:hypothetical protein NUL63_004577 [Salmonella enterica]|nr:hypothetical protein [Salmonella enterica]